jgi:hypothetical protein
MLTKLFGQSRLQEEFKKSILLKLELLIFSIQEIEVVINGNSIRKMNSLSNIHFDFKCNSLKIEGDFLKDCLNEDFFQIATVQSDSEPYEILLSNSINPEIITAKVRIFRSYLLIEGTLENWYCKLSKDIKISH